MAKRRGWYQPNLWGFVGTDRRKKTVKVDGELFHIGNYRRETPQGIVWMARKATTRKMGRRRAV